MKLELKHLAPYLQHNLKCQVTDKRKRKIATLGGLYNDGNCVFHDTIESEKGFKRIKPLLLPLSALYEVIDGEIGIVQLIHILSGADTPDIKKSRVVKIGSNYKVLYNSILYKDIWYSASLEYNEGKWSYYWEGELTEFNQLALFDYLFSHHYDVFDLCSKGFAIDKRSVK